MGYVLVDPGRITSLAKALHALHASLSAEPETIRGPYHGWGSDLSVAPLTSSTGRVGNESDRMDDRAVLAFAATTLPRVTSTDAPPQTMFGISWDYTEQELAVASQQVANSLRRVDEEYPYDGEDHADAANAALEQQLRDIGALLDMNRDDTTFQQSFWPVAAPFTARLAERMRQGTNADGSTDPLSQEWRQVLAQYSTSFAAASMLHQAGKIDLPETTSTPFTQAADEDMWSVGAFIASGPSGDQWSSRFLADAGTRVLQWREDHQGEIPTFFEGGIYGGQYVGSAIVGDDGGWYHSIGIDVGDGTYVSTDMAEMQRRMGLVAANDPALAILGKLGENQAASQLLLSDPTHGATNADRLVEFDWDYTGTGADESSAPGRVITQATYDRGGDETGRRSAVAAGNVFEAVEAEAGADRSDRDEELWPRLPGGLQDAVTQTAVTYLPDLAASSDEYAEFPNAVTLDENSGMYTVQSNAETTVGVLDILRDDPTGWGVFGAANDHFIETSVTYQATNPDSPNYLRQGVALDALMQLTENDERYEEGQERDAEAARVKTFYDAGWGIVGQAAEAHPVVKAVTTANDILGPILIDPLFETSYADEASAENGRLTMDRLSSYQLPIAQGLVDAGAISPPAGASFVSGGRIVLETPEEHAAFTAWWNQQSAEITAYESDARAQFTEITSDHEDEIDKFRDE